MAGKRQPKPKQNHSVSRVKDRESGLFIELAEPLAAMSITVFARQKEKIEAIAKDRKLGKSEVIREILDNYFEGLSN